MSGTHPRPLLLFDRTKIRIFKELRHTALRCESPLDPLGMKCYNASNKCLPGDISCDVAYEGGHSRDSPCCNWENAKGDR